MTNLHIEEFKYFRLICINIRHPEILPNLTVTHGFNMDIRAFKT